MGCITSKYFNRTRTLHNDGNIKTPVPEHISWNDTISFLPPVSSGRVIKVYDGDTITVASKLPIPDSPIYRFQIRLAGIDTPELHGNESERYLALIAKNTLSNKILGQMVHLKNLNHEKYGRLLATVYLDDLCINDWMVEQKLAIKYDGGKKIFDKWKDYFDSSKMK